MKIEFDINIPEGYEATGEYRRARIGEYYLSVDAKDVFIATGSADTSHNRIILRPKKRKVIKFVEDANGLYAIAAHGGFVPAYMYAPAGTTRYSRTETTE